MRNKFITTEPREREFYKGIPIHADLGLHEEAFALFEKYCAKGATALDVGAGAGAFSQRLADAGYRPTALDVDKEKWIPRDIEFLNLDINKGVSASVDKTYDAACCLEVVEHVENPWELARDLRKVVEPGGLLLLTTPNITSFWSRMYFLRSGYFHGFMPYDLDYGHISPISAHEMKLIAKNTGWEILEIRPGGYLPIFDFSEPTKLPLLFSNLFRWFFYLVSKNHKEGWCLMFMMRKLPDDEATYSPGKYRL